ncbi:MAG: MFS transporter [Candidatus Sumerlaeia bacterium]|nr:MFS transporter [Candidatus Sumerlaeia bacterium]
MKKLTPVVAIMAVFTLATCFIMIGSVSEELKAKLKITNTDIGTLMMALMLASLAVQLMAGLLVDRFGHKPMAIVGFLVSSASILLLAFASSFAVAVVASVFLGIGAICCNTVGNTLLPVVLFDGKEPARASNFGNAFVGLAFVLTPLAIVTLINDVGMSYAATLSVIAVLIFVFAVFAIISDYPSVPTGFKLSMAVELLRQPAVLLAALALVCYMGLEFTMNTWSKPLMTEMFGGADAPNAVRNAGRALAMFGLAMAVGRFIFSTVKNLSQIGSLVIAATSAVAIVSILVLSKTGSTTLAIAAILVTGLALAPMFPTIVGVTFGKFDSSLYGSIFGIIFSIGLLGSMILPKIIGALSEGRTVQQSLPIAAVIAAALLVVALLMGRTGKVKQ